MALKPATLLLGGQLRIVHMLGKGGMAEVYLADCTIPTLPAQVAIKRMLPELTRHADMFDKFRRESEVLAQLGSHPNVVQLYKPAAYDSDCFFFVLEYVEGQDLRTLLRRQRGQPLSSELVVYIGRQILAALHAAHSAYGPDGRIIIHLDVKPENVLVDEHGNVKLTDFGIARSRETATATMQTFVAGTDLYMAPEQHQQLPVDARTDLWAVGVILFELLTGHHPFAKASFAQLVEHICTGQRLELAPLAPPGTPRPLLALIEGLLTVQANDRTPQTAGEALQQLERVPIDTTRAAAEAGARVRGQDAPAGLDATRPAADASTAPSAPIQAGAEQQPLPATPRPRSRSNGWSGRIVAVALLALLGGGATLGVGLFIRLFMPQSTAATSAGSSSGSSAGPSTPSSVPGTPSLSANRSEAERVNRKVHGLVHACLQPNVSRLRDSRREYLAGVDPATGPTGRERSVRLGLLPRTASLDCHAAVQRSNTLQPRNVALEAAAGRYDVALHDLAQTLRDLESYYETGRFRQDRGVRGRARHWVVRTAYDEVLNAARDLTSHIQRLQDTVRAQRIATASSSPARRSEHLALRLQQQALVVVRLSDGLLLDGDSRLVGNAVALQAANTELRLRVDAASGHLASGSPARRQVWTNMQREAAALVARTAECVQQVQGAAPFTRQQAAAIGAGGSRSLIQGDPNRIAGAYDLLVCQFNDLRFAAEPAHNAPRRRRLPPAVVRGQAPEPTTWTGGARDNDRPAAAWSSAASASPRPTRSSARNLPVARGATRARLDRSVAHTAYSALTNCARFGWSGRVRLRITTNGENRVRAVRCLTRGVPARERLCIARMFDMDELPGGSPHRFIYETTITMRGSTTRRELPP